MVYNVPIVASEHSTDCGATCLCMLLKYNGIEVPLDQLRQECNTRLIGCSMRDLYRVATAHGLEPHAFTMDADELFDQDRPAIILWKKTHFVVFSGKDSDGSIVINNPSRGRYPLSAESSEVFYSGYALFNGVPETLPPETLANEQDFLDALAEFGVNVDD